MAITVVFAGIATGDYDSALAWYERLLGRPPDLIPKEDEVAWQVAEMGWIYLIADASRAGKPCSRSSWTTLEAMSLSWRNGGLSLGRSRRCVESGERR
jgi:hypothetical protein